MNCGFGLRWPMVAAEAIGDDGGGAWGRNHGGLLHQGNVATTVNFPSAVVETVGRGGAAEREGTSGASNRSTAIRGRRSSSFGYRPERVHRSSASDADQSPGGLAFSGGGGAAAYPSAAAMARRVAAWNGFLHFDIGLISSDSYTQANRFCRSAPAILLHGSWHTKYPWMEVMHTRKECTPCAYFAHKKDGCRFADKCVFCHLCNRGEIRRRKRAKLKSIKEQEKAERQKMSSGCTTSQQSIFVPAKML